LATTPDPVTNPTLVKDLKKISGKRSGNESGTGTGFRTIRGTN
jgi:hypothetical protein